MDTRSKHIAAVLGCTSRFLQNFMTEKHHQCEAISARCDATVLGSVLKGLLKCGPYPPPKEPFPGMSLDKIMEALEEMELFVEQGHEKCAQTIEAMKTKLLEEVRGYFTGAYVPFRDSRNTGPLDNSVVANEKGWVRLPSAPLQIVPKPHNALELAPVVEQRPSGVPKTSETTRLLAILQAEGAIPPPPGLDASRVRLISPRLAETLKIPSVSSVPTESGEKARVCTRSSTCAQLTVISQCQR